MSFGSTNVYNKNMKSAESNNFKRFLNLNIYGTPHLNELIFWIYINNKRENPLSDTVMKLFSFLNSFSVNFLKANATSYKFCANFMIQANDIKSTFVAKLFAPKNDIFQGFWEKTKSFCLTCELLIFVFKNMSIWIGIYWLIISIAIPYISMDVK